MSQDHFFKVSLHKPDGRNLFLYARHPVSKNIEATSPPYDEQEAKPEMRWHPLRNEWVIFASHRQNRTFLPPKDYSPLSVTQSPEFPTELPQGDYEIAVFENLFPSMNLKAKRSEGVPAEGICEVVVFTKDPDTSLGELPIDRIKLILEVIGERTRALGQNPKIKYVLPFENRGVEQGVTLNHPHGQIYAYPFVPPIPAVFLASMKKHWEDKKTGLLDEIIRDEMRDGRRILVAEEDAVAFIPSFARYPYETWIAPTRATPYLHDLSSVELEAFARVLKSGLQKMDRLWSRPFPYLLNIFQAPVDSQPHPEAHVHIQIYPPYRTRDRLKYLAGTELGGGVYVNDSLPEEKALELQKVVITSPDKIVVARAHGRVNLMGDHTDYNNGFVLPTPIPQFTEVKLTLVEGNAVTLNSTPGAGQKVGRRTSYELGHELKSRRQEDEWADYLMGTTHILEMEGVHLTGFNLEVSSNVPEGSGLSSSAALVMSFLKALRETFELPFNDLELARLGQRVENEYVGACVGIMDQIACILGHANEALFLDTQSLQFERVPLPTDKIELLTIHTGITHRNIGGGYKDRRMECEQACQELHIASLRELSLSDLPKLARLSTTLRKRARHVITENARVLDTVAAIRKEDFLSLGKLFRDSHASLRDDFEVSLPEIDLLVKFLIQEKSVYGARLTGGGFGGSIVLVANKGFAESGAGRVMREYTRHTGEIAHAIR